MDFLSGEIILFDFHFQLVSEELDQSLISERNYKLLTDLEGQLNIYLEGDKFFSEDGILLLELGIELTKWVNRTNRGSFSDFIYDTMSFSEGPILEIFQLEDAWFIRSIWQNFTYNKKISFDSLIFSINSFLINLREELIGKYKVDIEWFKQN